MPRRGGKHYVLVKGAEQAMRAFKYEVLTDMGLLAQVESDDGFEKLTTVQVGQIGGEMVRRIQAAGEWAILQRYNSGADRLMPEDVLPDPKKVRTVTNNGNISVDITQDPARVTH